MVIPFIVGERGIAWGVLKFSWKFEGMNNGKKKQLTGDMITAMTKIPMTYFSFGPESGFRNDPNIGSLINPISSMYGIFTYVHLVDAYGKCR